MELAGEKRCRTVNVCFGVRSACCETATGSLRLKNAATRVLRCGVGNGEEAMLQSVGLPLTALIAPLQRASNYTAYKNVCLFFLELVFFLFFQQYGLRTYFASVQS